MGERWPYPVSQAMQRQTGCRIKALRPAPASLPMAPEAASELPAAEPALPPSINPCQTDLHPED